MTQEEKAKAYDEMVQCVKELHEAGNDLTKKQMEIICPELAESEEDRIRKDIIALIKFAIEDGSAVSPGSHTTKEEALAYLEKQKEQNSSDEYIRRNSKELNALLAEQYDKGFWKGKSEKKTL